MWALSPVYITFYELQNLKVIVSIIAILKLRNLGGPWNDTDVLNIFVKLNKHDSLEGNFSILIVDLAILFGFNIPIFWKCYDSRQMPRSIEI